MKLKLGRLSILWADPCELKACNYYKFYLRYSKPGIPDMPHAAYHLAEKQCRAWEDKAETYLGWGRDVPYSVEMMCQKYEKLIRA